MPSRNSDRGNVMFRPAMLFRPASAPRYTTYPLLPEIFHYLFFFLSTQGVPCSFQQTPSRRPASVVLRQLLPFPLRERCVLPARETPQFSKIIVCASPTEQRWPTGSRVSADPD